MLAEYYPLKFILQGLLTNNTHHRRQGIAMKLPSRERCREAARCLSKIQEGQRFTYLFSQLMLSRLLYPPLFLRSFLRFFSLLFPTVLSYCSFLLFFE
jgi:hypothetical protein